MKKESLKLFDTVAILKDISEKKVVFGQVGTIVEELETDVFEVEFVVFLFGVEFVVVLEVFEVEFVVF